jgi:hypothetical protein
LRTCPPGSSLTITFRIPHAITIESSISGESTMVFVDTSAWFASVVPDDPDHAAAIKWLRENERLLITTDYVVDEILTLLRARGQNRRAAALGSRL